MNTGFVQSYPRKEGTSIVHKTWNADLECALRVCKWERKGKERLHQEVAEMAQHFPRWLLTVGNDTQLLRCRHCSGMLVFEDGLRCVQCTKEQPVRQLPEAARLGWFGLMPPIGIDGLSRLKGALKAGAPPQHVVGTKEGIGNFLLVPLFAIYPPGFPTTSVRVAYLPGMFQIPGIPPPVCSHAYHMIGGGVMCLFAAGDWHADMTCREVLQQRAYAHVIKLLNYADGKKNAFAIVS